MGGELLVLVFIVIIIGGLGSVTGCFVGATLVALIANYAGFLAPKLALVSNILLDGGGAAVAPARALSAGGQMRLLSGDPPRGWPARGAGRAGRAGAGGGAVPVSGRQAARRRREDLRDGGAGRVLRRAARLYRRRLLRACDVLRRRRLWGRARLLCAGAGLGRAGAGARRRRWRCRRCWRSPSGCSRCGCRRSSSPW